MTAAAVNRRAEDAKVSVVIPALNDAERLTRLLADLRDGPALEIVVVDGGSHDDTRAVAEANADLTLSTPTGRGEQLCAGAERATGDWLWFLHADSRVPRQAVEWLVRIGPTRRGWGWFDVRLDGTAWPLRVVEAAMNWRSALTGVATGDHGIFVHRGLLAAAGGVPRQPLMEDVELCRRLRRLAKPRRAGNAIATSARRWERDGVGRTVVRMWVLRLRYFFGADPTALANRYYP